MLICVSPKLVVILTSFWNLQRF